jgi:hypothetical protein
MSSNDLPTPQTDAVAEPRATVIETSTPGQVVARVDGCDGTVSGLSRNLTSEAPSSMAVSERPDARFKPGNQAAVKHGLYAAKPVEALPAEVQAEIDDFRAGVLSDLGAEADLSALERGYVRRICDVEALVRLSALNIHKNGFTAKSEGMLLQAVDRWDRIAQRVGTNRRLKDVGAMSIGEFLEHERSRQPRETR